MRALTPHDPQTHLGPAFGSTLLQQRGGLFARRGVMIAAVGLEAANVPGGVRPRAQSELGIPLAC